MLPWIGGLIVLLTVYGIVRRWETRMVLFSAGLLMALIAGRPMDAFAQFEKSMTNAGLIASILSVMGFAYVMKLTKCDQHLVEGVAGAVARFRAVLIPLATMATFLINIALPSAAGVTAAVGAVLIPVLMATGVHPAVAAAAVFAGSYGSVLSPGSAHIVMVSEMAGITELETIAVITPATVIAGLIGAVSLAVYAFITKEDRGYKSGSAAEREEFRVNWVMALVPVLPLALLIIGAMRPAETWKMSVPAAMLIGSLVATLVSFVVNRTSPAEISRSFFDGMGKAYGDIMGIIIAAGVFAGGLSLVGLIGSLLNAMTGARGAIGAVATWGPMLVAILSGSGDAATIAFNEAVTPHAAQFGLTIPALGTVASLAGSLGRTMSPVAGACIVAAGIAGVSPVEVAKRNAPGMILASLVTFALMGL